MGSRIRKGDLVAVVSGEDKGKRGRVLRVIREKDRVVVEGVNLVYKHLRRGPKHPQGGRIRREAPLHVSNVMPIDPETNAPTRVRTETTPEGRRVRVAHRSGARLVAGAGGRRAEGRADTGRAEGRADAGRAEGISGGRRAKGAEGGA